MEQITVPPEVTAIIGDVTADQGTAASPSGAWPVNVYNGLNEMPAADAVSRALFAKITDGANTLGTALNPLRTNPTGGTAQPVSGTVTGNQGTAAALASAWPVKVTDGTNIMPTADANTRPLFTRITDGTTNLPVGAATVSTSMPINKAIEAVRTSLTGTTGNTPSTQNTAVIMGTITGLSDYESFAVEATLAGTDGTAAGGPLDFVVQCSPDGTNWTDWCHFPTVASGDAAKTYRFVPTFSGTITQVTTETGSGTTISLGSGLSSGGHPGAQIRLKAVLGTAASPHAVAQTAFLVATRPKQ